ncbi:hypothetical protein MMC24_003991 [Lignoscripta atroalba]|nr:hypothetical protein [Lignoscripta atroalba]
MAAPAAQEQAFPASIMAEKMESMKLNDGVATPSDASDSKPASIAPKQSAMTNGVSPGQTVKVPLEYPLDVSKPLTPAPLTTEQTTAYDTVLSTASSWTNIPNTSARDSATAPITDTERMWLSRECLLRYLRATKWSPSEASTRLLSTLTWRREFGVYTTTPEQVSIENETGKQVLLGYDFNARPCLYLNPGKQNTKTSQRQIQHLVFDLECLIDIMPPGVETWSLLINYSKATSSSSPSIATGRQVSGIFQNHYPERLGKALMTNLPWFIWGFFKVITPILDPLTRPKLTFNENLRNHVPPTQLLSTHGGDVDFEYDHSVYWPALLKLAAQRKKEYEERWVRGGKRIGESEMYLKGGDGKSLAEMEKQG